MRWRRHSACTFLKRRFVTLKVPHTGSTGSTGPLVLGSGNASEGQAGTVAISSGSGTTVGADVVLTAGSSQSAISSTDATKGGDVIVRAGDGSGEGAGGTVKVSSGTASEDGRSTGPVVLTTAATAGDERNAAASGDISLSSGDARGRQSGQIRVSSGSTTSGAVGGVVLVAGSSQDSGGGDLLVAAGDSESAPGGSLELQSGGSDTGKGGNLDLQAGVDDVSDKFTLVDAVGTERIALQTDGVMGVSTAGQAQLSLDSEGDLNLIAAKETRFVQTQDGDRKTLMQITNDDTIVSHAGAQLAEVTTPADERMYESSSRDIVDKNALLQSLVDVPISSVEYTDEWRSAHGLSPDKIRAAIGQEIASVMPHWVKVVDELTVPEQELALKQFHELNDRQALYDTIIGLQGMHERMRVGPNSRSEKPSISMENTTLFYPE